jgi:anti-anti-sigma factor
MSGASTIQAHIAYELIDATDPQVVVIEFLSRAIADPGHAYELGEELSSLVRSDLPRQFVIDFKNVRTLGSTAFGEIVAFVRAVRRVGGQVKVCNIDEIIRLGATLIGLDDFAEFAASRRSAIDACLKSAEPCEFLVS